MAVAALSALSLAWAAGAGAQKRPLPEFTRQGLLVMNFQTGTGADWRVGRKLGDEIRDRAAKLLNGREVEVIGGNEVQRKMALAGFPADFQMDPGTLEAVSRIVRADEYVVGRITRGPDGVHVDGELHIMRNRGTRQPIEPTVAPDIEQAAQKFARGIAAARTQLSYQRRCANALRDQKPAIALEAAKQGIAAAPDGAYIRACYLGAVTLAGTTAAERLAAAQAVLAIDSTSREALDGAARALDLLQRPQEGGAMWLRLVASDSENVDVISRVVFALLEEGNARLAAPVVTRVIAGNPTEIQLLRLDWQVAFAMRDWGHAAKSGEAMLERDGMVDRDSTFVAKLITAHRSAGEMVRAVELAARNIGRFPGDGRIYAMYAELVRAESDSAVRRGIAMFPKSAELHALAAREYKASGRAEDALAAIKQAVALDSMLPQGVLSIAQAEFELGRPDSALVSLGRALERGEDTATVVQFALAKGNTLLRAANQTQVRDDYQRALRFFALADHARATPQSKFLLGTAALNVSKSALTDAPKLTDKPASCTLARLGQQMLDTAKAGLAAGQEVASAAAEQYLAYAAQLDPFASRQVGLYCDAPTPAAAPTDTTHTTPRVPVRQ